MTKIKRALSSLMAITLTTVMLSAYEPLTLTAHASEGSNLPKVTSTNSASTSTITSTPEAISKPIATNTTSTSVSVDSKNFYTSTFPTGITSDFYYADNGYTGKITLSKFNFGYASGRWVSVYTLDKDGLRGPEFDISATWGVFDISVKDDYSGSKSIVKLEAPEENKTMWRESYDYSVDISVYGDGKAYLHVLASDPVVPVDSSVSSTAISPTDKTFIIDGVYGIDRSVNIGDCAFNLSASASSTNPPPIVPNPTVPVVNRLKSIATATTPIDKMGGYSFADNDFHGKLTLSNATFGYLYGRWITLQTVGKDGSNGPSIKFSICCGAIAVNISGQVNKTLTTVVLRPDNAGNRNFFKGPAELVVPGDGKAYLTIGDRTFEIDGAYAINKNIDLAECKADIEAFGQIAPKITLNGSPSVTVVKGDKYVDAGATAVDDFDGDVTANIKTTGDVNTSVTGTYTVTYTVSDSDGNAAAPVTRTVAVIKPNSITPSTCEFNPSNPRDIIVTLSDGTTKLIAVKNESSVLTSSDYSVSGSAVTINKSYLTYFFNKFNSPDQKLFLTFDFDNGNDPVLTVTRASTITYGDLNNDGKVNSADSSILKRIILGTYTGIYNASNADMNSDTKINSADYSLLKRKILN